MSKKETPRRKWTDAEIAEIIRVYESYDRGTGERQRWLDDEIPGRPGPRGKIDSALFSQWRSGVRRPSVTRPGPARGPRGLVAPLEPTDLVDTPVTANALAQLEAERDRVVAQVKRLEAAIRALRGRR